MKLLIYSEFFLPVPGGTQSIVLNLANGLAEWSSRNSTIDPIEITVVTRTLDIAPEDTSFPFRLVRGPVFWELVQLVRQANVVHLAGPAMLPLLLSLLLRKPTIIEHHGFQAACPTGLLFYQPDRAPCPGYFMARQYGKCIKCQKSTDTYIKGVGKILLTKFRRFLGSRASMNIMPTQWLGTVLKLKRMQTIHHGISDGTEEISDKPDVGVFAYHGRLVSTKGVNVLIEAAQKLWERGYQFRLKIIGDGDESAPLRSMSAHLGGEVEFLGHVPEEEMEKTLSDVSTIVMPSLGGEVFGLVAAENMLRGKLLIVSDLGPLREVVGDTGLYFRAGDSEDLARCMREVIEDASLPPRLGPVAHARVSQVFDRDSMILRHIRVYQEVISLERTRA